MVFVTVNVLLVSVLVPSVVPLVVVSVGVVKSVVLVLVLYVEVISSEVASIVDLLDVSVVEVGSVVKNALLSRNRFEDVTDVTGVSVFSGVTGVILVVGSSGGIQSTSTFCIVLLGLLQSIDMSAPSGISISGSF